MSEHERFQEDIGAYLLGALDRDERGALERHLETCGDCQEQLERLRPAADALPGSVEQLKPPRRLKKALMAEVDPRPRRSRPKLFLRPVLVAAAVGLVVGLGVTQLGGDETRTVAVTVDEAMPRAGGNLEIADDSATLHLHDMPDLGERRVYQVWLQHGERMVPARTFEIGAGGSGDVDLRDVGDADGVYVTREARGGAQVPSEDPIVSIPL
jgi:anti-sigma-K factor RskA